MRTRDLNFVRMTGAVLRVLKRYENEWKDKKRFAGYVAEFKKQAGLLSETAVNADINTTGATIDKHSARYKAISLGVKLAKRASIYAVEEENMQLHDQLRISRSALLHWHDKEAITKLKDVHKRMSNLMPELEDYLVYKEDLVKLYALIQDFEEREADPRDLVIERKGQNDLLSKHFTGVRKVLYKMDSMINVFEDSPFEDEYLLARKVIHLGEGHNDKGDEDGKGDKDDKEGYKEK